MRAFVVAALLAGRRARGTSVLPLFLFMGLDADSIHFLDEEEKWRGDLESRLLGRTRCAEKKPYAQKRRRHCGKRGHGPGQAAPLLASGGNEAGAGTSYTTAPIRLASVVPVNACRPVAIS